MADFFSTDPAHIDERLTRYFDQASASGQPLFPDHRVPGTPGYNFRQLWRRLLVDEHRQTNRLLSGMSPITAEGQALDAWGGFFGLPRRQAEGGRLTVRAESDASGAAIERLVGSRRIASGTPLDGGRVTLTEALEIPAAGTVAEAAAVASPGVRLEAGQPIALAGPLGGALSLTVAAAAPGAERETDEQYRYRLARTLRAPSSNVGLEAVLLAADGVSNVALTEARYGPGTIEAFVTPSDAFPAPELRSVLEALYQGPSRLYVVLPDYEAIALKVRAPGGSAHVVAEYVNNLGVGEPVVLSRLESALLAAGATDAQVLSARRGLASEDGTPIDPVEVRQMTNLTARSNRSKWYCRAEWVTICS